MENNVKRDKLRLSDQKGNWEIWDAFCHKIKKKRERERLNTKGGQKKFEVYRIGSNQRHGSWCLTIPRVCRDVSSSLRFGRSVFYLYGGGKKREKEREKKKKRKEKEEREIEGERKKLEDASRITAVALLISVILYLPVFIIGLNDTE